MEDFQEARARAEQKLKIADHVLTQTYPLVDDPKLLLAVMENLFLALSNAMSSLLFYERTFKRIPSFVNNFENKFNIFKEKVAISHNLSVEYISLISDVKEIINAHKKSPVEFSRKDCFVICSDNYRLKTISLEQIKRYISLSKDFLREIHNITKKDERIFK